MRFDCAGWWKAKGMGSSTSAVLARGACCAVAALLAVPAASPAVFDGPVQWIEPPPSHVFPIDGRHELQRWEDNGFGGARQHKGQDLFAPCGTPVVAAEGGRVRHADYEGAAGNYVVIRGAETGQDAVYMHLRHASRLSEGDHVDTAGRVGDVGQSGDASGCHLHFELWTKPGWYRGGEAYDPLPRLRRWDRP